MRKLQELTPFVVMLLVLTVCFSPPAHAYLDLTTGSYAAQMAFMVLAGSVIALRTWIKNSWSRVVAFVKKPNTSTDP